MTDGRFSARVLDGSEGTTGNTPAVYSDTAVRFVASSVPVILLPAGSTAANVPAGTPVGTIILVKA